MKRYRFRRTIETEIWYDIWSDSLENATEEIIKKYYGDSEDTDFDNYISSDTGFMLTEIGDEED